MDSQHIYKADENFVFLNTLILEAMMGEKNYSTVVTSIYDVFCDFCKQRNSFFFFGYASQQFYCKMSQSPYLDSTFETTDREVK